MKVAKRDNKNNITNVSVYIRNNIDRFNSGLEIEYEDGTKAMLGKNDFDMHIINYCNNSSKRKVLINGLNGKIKDTLFRKLGSDRIDLLENILLSDVKTTDIGQKIALQKGSSKY